MENQDNSVQNVQQSNNGNVLNKTSSDSGSATVPGRNNDRKIFVGGLSGETTENDLRDYFTKFGAIESVNIKVDQTTGNSKGFGFIVFNAVETVKKVTEAGEHVINNKKIDAQIAKVRNGKIFVGGITSELSDEDIKVHFGQFGNIVGVEMPFDKIRNQRKNFGFVIFESEQVARKVLETPKQIIKNVEVDIKRPVAKPSQGFPPQRSSEGYGQNWSQPQGNQTYGGYGFGQQGYGGSGGMYGGYDAGYSGYGTYATPAYENYGNGDQGANGSYGAGRGSSRGGPRGAGRGGNRGRGAPRGRGGNSRFQPY